MFSNQSVLITIDSIVKKKQKNFWVTDGNVVKWSLFTRIHEND